MPGDPFYASTAWRRLRKLKLLHNPLCEECGRPATDVDHIKAINAGGDAFDLRGLRSLCHACHSKKTFYIDRLKRDRIPVKGCKPDGTPLDPGHPWNKPYQDKGTGEIARPDAFKGQPRAMSEKTFAVADDFIRARIEEQS